MKSIITGLLFLILSNISIAQNDINCKIYRTGYFEFEGKHSNIVIYRNKNYQIEYNIENGEWVTIKMNWTSDCKYSFTYINTNMNGLKQYIGHSLDVEIATGNSEGYIYHSVYKKGGKEFDGKIVFLVTELKNSEKRKIKKKLKKTKT